MKQQPGEYSVYQEFRDGTRERVRDHVSDREAVEAAYHYTTCVGAKLGTTVKVMVTDDGDCCVFLWERDKGIVWPTPAEGLRPDLQEWGKQ